MRNFRPSSTPPSRHLFSHFTHSIRTRYSLATAFFLLFILAIFYIGGRIVLVHLVKDAEKQVREIGTHINRLALRNTDSIKKHAAALPPEDKVKPIDQFLGTFDGVNVSLAIRLTANGSFIEGFMTGDKTNEPITDADIKTYSALLPDWVYALTNTTSSAHQTKTSGILNIRGKSVYAASTEGPGGRFLILGTPFNSDGFTAQVNKTFSGMEVHISNRTQSLSAVPMTVNQIRRKKVEVSQQHSFGIVPMVDEALDFYSGGFWKLAENPFEAIYTIRDIAGNPVSVIAVSLPKTFSNAAGIAIGRLTLFVSLVGILLVLPIFWFQSHILLNPLSKMTDCVRKAREHCGDAECPRLDWKGDDEFAELAFSVNSLLETISRRTMAIAQVENRQKALIRGLPDGLMIFDRNHRLVTIIKQPDGVPEIPGMTEGSPLDSDVFGQDGLISIGAALDKVFSESTVENIILESGTSASRRTFDVRLSLTDRHFVLAIVRDISARVAEHNRRVAAETRLAHTRKQESLTLLAGSIAHDVNNVLAAVLNTAEITWMDATDPDVISAVDTIREAVRRGSQMTRELMTFAGETKVSFKTCDPSDLVRQTQKLSTGIIPEGTTITYNLAENLPHVDADPDQLWKVFFNLVKNAAEAMNGLGEIKVSTSSYQMTEELAVNFMSSKTIQPGLGVLFQIDDTGPGIRPEMLRRMFDPYVSTKSTGRGFGLSTVASIVEAHNGGIQVVSQIGHGTSFRIYLPSSKEQIIPRHLPDASSTFRAALRETCSEILLVDDDPAILKTTSILLRVLKFTVYSSTSHHEALDIFRKHSHCLRCVIMDAHLNESDSVHLLSVFRSINPEVPVVVSSGSARETVDTIFKSQPFNKFLPKPYTVSDIQNVILSC